MQSPDARPGMVADAQAGNWVDRFAPDWLKPYARLARWDRPIGFWLLFWPCAFSLSLAAIVRPVDGFDVQALLLCFVGAVAMRGAGCTFNDIVDTQIDMQVERTRSRPIPSGQVTRLQATLFLALQAAVGAAVLFQFNALTIWLGIASLALVAIYPFMKRVTWWPQLFLGLAFSWGTLIGWTSQVASIGPTSLLLYAGCVLWTIGYDTIYALQDVEDDALIGVRSTARLFGSRSRPIVGLFYAASIACWLAAALLAGADALLLGLMVVPAGLLGWQVRTLDPADANDALTKFRSNHWVGLALTLALLTAALARGVRF